MQNKSYFLFWLCILRAIYNVTWLCLVAFHALTIAYNKGCTKIRTNGTRRVGGQPTKGLVKHIIPHRHGCLTTAAQTKNKSLSTSNTKQKSSHVTSNATKSKQTIISRSALLIKEGFSVMWLRFNKICKWLQYSTHVNGVQRGLLVWSVSYFNKQN